MSISHKFLEQLEPEATKSIETDDEAEIALVASVALSLKRIADLLERLEPILRRPPRT